MGGLNPTKCTLLSPEMNEAFITGEVLTWARERRNLSQPELARLINVTPEQIANWEAEITYPPYAKAKRLAEKLKVPFGYFFFASRPSDDTPLPDFRFLADPSRRKLSPDLIEHINNVLNKQEWYREYMEGQGKKSLRFVGSFAISDAPEKIAEAATAIAQEIQITDQRRLAGDWTDYLSRLIHRAEELGVLVIRTGIVKSSTRRSMTVEEFRGFAASDDLAPLIAINAKDSVAARIFTLVHELVHIWIGKGGISNSDGIDADGMLGIEKFCNAVAVQVLMPASEFDEQWRRYGRMSDRMDKLASIFRVSARAIIRRAMEMDKLTRAEFFAELEMARKREKQPKKSKGGNPDRNLRARNSGLVTDAALKAVRIGKLVYRDAAALLGTSLSYIYRLSDRVTVQ